MSTETKIDPRDPDHTKEGMFVLHNCWKCQNGKKPCVEGRPTQCSYPHARNDWKFGVMGFVTAFSPCLTCKQIFGYNPHKVPSSSAVTGTREPICQNCINLINRKRIDIGLDPFIISPDAYKPLPEEDLQCWPEAKLLIGRIAFWLKLNTSGQSLLNRMITFHRKVASIGIRLQAGLR